MMRTKALACLFLALWPFVIKAQPYPLEERLQTRLDELHDAGVFPGATFALLHDHGSLIHLASGFSNVETKEKMKPQARMFSGSIGKMFVAALVLQLVGEEKLRLDDRISIYFENDEQLYRMPNYAETTVRMLLNHTSGLPRYILNAKFWQDLMRQPDGVWAPEALLRYVHDSKPVHPAGKGWAYSDTGYIILGMIIEKITGHRYNVLLQERILTPLHLSYTSPSDRRIIADLPAGETGQNVPPFFLPKDVLVNGKYLFNPQFEWTGGGLVTNSRDLVIWAEALYEGEIISADLLKQMLTTVSYQTGAPDSIGYGFAVMRRKTDFGYMYGHSGIFPGYQSIVEYSPRYRCAIAIQVNADRFSGKLGLGMSDMIDALLPTIAKYHQMSYAH